MKLLKILTGLGLVVVAASAFVFAVTYYVLSYFLPLPRWW